MDRKETMAILQKYTHTPLHVRKYGLPSFILFSHKINYSYKCILMFHGRHEDVSLGVSPARRGRSCKLTPLEMPTLRGTRISSDEQVR